MGEVVSDIRQVTPKQIAKAFRVPRWIIGQGKRPRWVRRQVQRWSGYRFWLCDQPITEAWPSPMCGTIDHVVPVSVDPTRILDRSNVRAAHLRCNSRRSDFQFGKRMLASPEWGGTPATEPAGHPRKTLAPTFLSGSETPGAHAQAG